MRRVLAIHPGALGDVLLAIPALRSLRDGAAALTLAAQPRIGALLVALGVVDHTVAVDTLGLEALFAGAALDSRTLVARHVADGARVVSWFGARDAEFVRGLRALAPTAVIASPTTSDGLVWEHLVRTARGGDAVRTARGGDARAWREPIATAPPLMDDARAALTAIGWDGASRILVVHPGAGGIAKRWPTAGFLAALDGVDAAVVVHQGPADAGAVRGFVDRVRGPVLQLVEPSLPTLAGVLALAGAYVGNDSGVSHLASAVGTPSLVLFTNAAWPWRPWSPTARCLVVRTSDLVDDEYRAVRAALCEML